MSITAYILKQGVLKLTVKAQAAVTKGRLNIF